MKDEIKTYTETTSCKCGGALIGVRARDGQWRIHCRLCGKATTGHRSKTDAMRAWDDGRTA